MTVTVTEVHAVMNNTTEPVLTAEQVESMVGQCPIITSGRDWNQTLGKAEITHAEFGQEIRLTLAVASPQPDPLGPSPVEVGIGFKRDHVPGTGITVFEISRVPQPPGSPGLTDEQRDKGTQMLRTCAALVVGVNDPAPPDATSGTRRCSSPATSMVKVGDNWYYRCTYHEGVVVPGVQGEVRPIPLVPDASEIVEPDGEWLRRTPWWRFAADAMDPQSKDFSGRDLYDVLVLAVGEEQARKVWDDACRLTDLSGEPLPLDRTGYDHNVDGVLAWWVGTLNEPTLAYAEQRHTERLARAAADAEAARRHLDAIRFERERRERAARTPKQ